MNAAVVAALKPVGARDRVALVSFLELRAKAARAKQFKCWTYPETLTFLAAVESDRDHACYSLVAFTGLRQGEVVALRWDAVDLEGRTLTVERSIEQGDGRQLRQASEVRRWPARDRARPRARRRAPRTSQGLNAECSSAKAGAISTSSFARSTVRRSDPNASRSDGATSCAATRPLSAFQRAALTRLRQTL